MREVPAVQNADDTLLHELRLVIAPWKMSRQKDLKGSASKLFVLDTPDEPVINKEQVYVPFTSVGMCRRLKECKGRSLKLVLDGKQKVVATCYGILTLGLVILRQKTSWASVRSAGKRGRVELHTSTVHPFLQALISTEPTPNITRAFQDAIWMCEYYGEFDLKAQLVQVHKDYAKGIEKARVDTLSMVRALDNFFHMMQQSPQTLEKRMSVYEDLSAGEQESCQKGRKRKSTRPAGRAKGKKARWEHRPKYLQTFIGFIQSTRIIPTVQLFDALWYVFFVQMTRSGEADACSYLQDTDFHQPTIDTIKRIYPGVKDGNWNRSVVLIAGHRYGLFALFQVLAVVA